MSAGKCIQNIEKWTHSQKRENDRLGLYGATSAIPTIFSKVKFAKKNLYIFDNDNDKQNKYLYSFPNTSILSLNRSITSCLIA